MCCRKFMNPFVFDRCLHFFAFHYATANVEPTNCHDENLLSSVRFGRCKVCILVTFGFVFSLQFHAILLAFKACKSIQHLQAIRTTALRCAWYCRSRCAGRMSDILVCTEKLVCLYVYWFGVVGLLLPLLSTFPIFATSSLLTLRYIIVHKLGYLLAFKT